MVRRAGNDGTGRTRPAFAVRNRTWGETLVPRGRGRVASGLGLNPTQRVHMSCPFSVVREGKRPRRESSQLLRKGRGGRSTHALSMAITYERARAVNDVSDQHGLLEANGLISAAELDGDPGGR